MHRLVRSVDNSLDLSYVRLPSSVGLAVGMGNVETKNNALAADITLCHLTDTSIRISEIISSLTLKSSYPISIAQDSEKCNRFPKKSYFSSEFFCF